MPKDVVRTGLIGKRKLTDNNADEHVPELHRRIALAISEGQMALAAQRARDAAGRADQKSKD
jgi:hypothetical protein